MGKEHTVFLALGSNLGDKQKNMLTACEEIEERIGTIVSLSAFYITKPEGFVSENLFVNAVCEVSSIVSTEDLFLLTKHIEEEMGRRQKSENDVYQDRIIDIDILMIDDLIINTPEWTIPHPRLHTRDFVLAPFNEIAPHVVHPVFKKTISELYAEWMRSQSHETSDRYVRDTDY